MSKPFQRYRTGKSVKDSAEQERLHKADFPTERELTDQDYYDQAQPDPMGDPFEQAKWFEENDIMN